MIENLACFFDKLVLIYSYFTMITNLKTNILVLFFTIIILFLIYPKILYEYFVFQMPFSDQAPQSYFADWTVIISAIKCKLLGNDVTETVATKERQKVTKYKGYELTEELDTGKKQIKIGDADYGKEEYMIYDPPETIIGKNNKPVEVPAQYDEVTVKPDAEGKMKDVDSGLDSFDEIIEEVRMKKSGGGVAYMLGE